MHSIGKFPVVDKGDTEVASPSSLNCSGAVLSAFIQAPSVAPAGIRQFVTAVLKVLYLWVVAQCIYTRSVS